MPNARKSLLLIFKTPFPNFNMKSLIGSFSGNGRSKISMKGKRIKKIPKKILQGAIRINSTSQMKGVAGASQGDIG